MGVSARWRICAVAFIGAAIGIVRPAGASGELTEKEAALLEAGRPVVREENVERGGRHYLGGVSYIVVDAAPEHVNRALDDVRAYRHILPAVRSVRWVGISRTGEALVELEQGNSIAHGSYTVRIRRDAGPVDSSSSTVRFWLDPRYSHDVADANGFFHLEARGEKTLLTYLVMVDLGPGLVGRLFEGRIRRAALSTPVLVKNYVESHRPPLK
jgi:carbon monoxide dehydrogenase subunit G